MYSNLCGLILKKLNAQQQISPKTLLTMCIAITFVLLKMFEIITSDNQNWNFLSNRFLSQQPEFLVLWLNNWMSIAKEHDELKIQKQ